MNKVLLAVVVVQTVLVAALVFRFGALQAQTDRMETAFSLYVSAERNGQGASIAPAPAAGSGSGGLSPESYEALRVIIREEVDRLADEIELAQTTHPTSRPSSSQSQQRQELVMAPAESARLYEEFQNDLASFRAKGAINSRDMVMLEQKIAGMPPAERMRALSELSREISQGSIDAKL